jgi:DNA mismatch repair protein MutS2
VNCLRHAWPVTSSGHDGEASDPATSPGAESASRSAGHLDHLEWAVVRDALRSRLGTPIARETATLQEGDELEPATDATLAERRLDEVDGLELALVRVEPSGLPRMLRAALREVHDLERPIAEAARGAALDLVTLVAVADLLEALRLLEALSRAAVATGDGSPAHAAATRAIVAVLAPVASRPALLERLRRSIDFTGGDSGRDREPVIADAASPALAAARRRIREARGELAKRADALVRRGDLDDALADRFWTEREGRVVLPVKSSVLPRSSVAGGIIHGASSSRGTLFVEPPQLIEDNNRLRQAQMAERAEVRRVIEALSAEIGREGTVLSAGLRAIVRFDRVAARLALSQDLSGVRPQVARAEPGDRLHLPAARHPGMVLAGRRVVPNDLDLAIGRILVISGPNAGGKTVALKTVGLCVLLAGAGIRVPTGPGARVPLFRRIVTDVGDDQSIARDLSTFSAHVGHLAEALEAAAEDGPGTLVLVDEVAAGTDPQQGAALAEAVLHALVDAGACGIVTTHYERIKLLAAHDDRFVNAAVGFDLEALAPTFRITVGVPGSSSAIAVARRLGLPEPVLSAAEAILDDDGRRVDVLLAQIEAERTRLHETRTRLEQEAADLSRERLRLAARDARELEVAEQRLAKAHRDTASELHRLESDLKRRRKRLAAAEAVAGDPESVEARAVARDARGELRRAAPAVVPPPAAAPPSIAVGDRVRVGALAAVGDVLAIKGERVTVQLPHAKVTVSALDLGVGPEPGPRPREASRAPARPASQAARHFGADAKAVDPGLDDIVDLRGQRADEAVTAVEVFLDRAIAEDREVVVLRHGHGSGALRRLVREHLPRLSHVVAHRPGLPAEGGDAVTVVWVRG